LDHRCFHNIMFLSFNHKSSATTLCKARKQGAKGYSPKSWTFSLQIICVKGKKKEKKTKQTTMLFYFPIPFQGEQHLISPRLKPTTCNSRSFLGRRGLNGVKRGCCKQYSSSPNSHPQQGVTGRNLKTIHINESRDKTE